MPEIDTFGLMSGGGKRSVGHRPQATAPILDSTATDIRWGIPVKSVGPLASLSNKQCDSLSVAEVLKRDIQ